MILRRRDRQTAQMLAAVSTSFCNITEILANPPPSLEERHVRELAKELQAIYPGREWWDCLKEARSSLK